LCDKSHKNNKGVLHKMLVGNFPIRIVKLTQSFLSDRKFHVTVGDGKSESHSVTSRVPQGAVLSPTLYNFFTHDFPTANGVEIALFADDTAVYCTSEDPDVITRELQTALNRINEYFSIWKVKANASKTQSVFFTRKRTRALPTYNLTLNGANIEWSNEAKYLGVTLDKRLTFKSHIQKTLEKIQKLIRILYPLINQRSRLDRKNKLLIYKTIFSSIMLYASPVWDACALSHLRLLQTQQNKCLKMILNLHWMHSSSDVHNLADIPTIIESIQTRHERFSNGLIFTNNPLIS
jgi:Reverse transcriptase (RNA-dependent DNA polymerase)